MHISLPNHTNLTNVKTLRQFDNLVFVIMSTREIIRLIARSPFDLLLHRLCPEVICECEPSLYADYSLRLCDTYQNS